MLIQQGIRMNVRPYTYMNKMLHSVSLQIARVTISDMRMDMKKQEFSYHNFKECIEMLVLEGKVERNTR